MIVKLIFTILTFLFSASDQKAVGAPDQAFPKENAADYQGNCTQLEKVSDNHLDPVLISICDFKDFRSISTGTADNKGRYYYTYQLFKIERGKMRRVENSELFPTGQEMVEERINRDLQREYEREMKDPRIQDCMKWRKPRQYCLNELGVSFTGTDQIAFYVSHGIGGACFNVGFSILKYNISEFLKYME